jgi:hypothetical protein
MGKKQAIKFQNTYLVLFAPTYLNNQKLSRGFRTTQQYGSLSVRYNQVAI